MLRPGSWRYSTLTTAMPVRLARLAATGRWVSRPQMAKPPPCMYSTAPWRSALAAPAGRMISIRKPGRLTCSRSTPRGRGRSLARLSTASAPTGMVVLLIGARRRAGRTTPRQVASSSRAGALGPSGLRTTMSHRLAADPDDDRIAAATGASVHVDISHTVISEDHEKVIHATFIGRNGVPRNPCDAIVHYPEPHRSRARARLADFTPCAESSWRAAPDRGCTPSRA